MQESQDLIEVNPNKMSGTSRLQGNASTAHLFGYLEKGKALAEFVRQFPSATHDQAVAVLKLSKKSLLTNHEIAA
jgi:uncharacterized protein (DUF433 family)